MNADELNAFARASKMAGMDILTALNECQLNHIISDNVVIVEDIAGADAERAIAFLRSREKSPPTQGSLL
jgi:hypothetical protein